MLTDEQAAQYEAENDALPRSVERHEGKFMVTLRGEYETLNFYYLTRDDAQKRYDCTIKYINAREGNNGRWAYAMISEILTQSAFGTDPVSMHAAYS